MANRLPVTLVTGPLGSGKTTLLRYIIEVYPGKLALVINEFGELGIDGKIVQGKNVQLTELDGGCVCCTLLGEFEAAVDEIIDTVDPDRLVVETTGLAEPEALVFNLEEDVPQVRLDGVVTIVDADAMVRFPSLGQTTRMQIEQADLLLLNKADLVTKRQTAQLQDRLGEINPFAPIVVTQFGRVDIDLLFGLDRQRVTSPPSRRHQHEFESFTYQTDSTWRKTAFSQLADRLMEWNVYRAKGFLRLEDGSYLFNFVAGRWSLEPFDAVRTELVFIGRGLRAKEPDLQSQLQHLCDTAETIHPEADHH